MDKALIKAAQNIIKQLKKHAYSEHEFDQPSIIEDDGGLLVVWESGSPNDWASNDTYSQHEEIVSLCNDAGFPAPVYDGGTFYIDPKGFHSEPMNGFSICIYAD